MRFRRFVFAAAAVVAALGMASCSSSSPTSGVKPVERNILTDLPGSNGRVLAVKFDDTNNAHPQLGIEKADVVFVTQVEAGLTRLLAIYSSNYPEQLAPIRSARISDIDILAQFGKVGFAYSGAQRKLRPVLEAANIVNLSAERNPPSIYFNDPNRTRPYAMTLNTEPLLAKAAGLERVKSIGYEHGTSSKDAQAIESVTIHWPNAKYEAIWNRTTRRFDLNHNGAPDLSADGAQIGSPMMVVQIVDIHPSEYGDKFGGITPKTTVVGQGHAYLLRGGKITRVFWSRPTAQAPTEWKLADGSPAKFARGQVWFFLTDREPDIAYTPTASPSPSK